jgi:hypothetical protein
MPFTTDRMIVHSRIHHRRWAHFGQSMTRTTGVCGSYGTELTSALQLRFKSWMNPAFQRIRDNRNTEIGQPDDLPPSDIFRQLICSLLAGCGGRNDAKRHPAYPIIGCEKIRYHGCAFAPALVRDSDSEISPKPQPADVREPRNDCPDRNKGAAPFAVFRLKRWHLRRKSTFDLAVLAQDRYICWGSGSTKETPVNLSLSGVDESSPRCRYRFTDQTRR